MAIDFTQEQRQVINLRNRNILVSAAAGSGKTAVLVERIIKRLTKDTPPLSVDQLLITTFTEAAAAEMKERIHNAIEKALEEDPENEHLQHQATLVHQAQIATIHKFCLSVIRDYFHTIDLDPSFRVAEDGELQLLKQDVASAVLEHAFQEGKSDFLTFVECFATGKNDNNLEDLILQLYGESRSYPRPNVWLDSCIEQYVIDSAEELENKPYMQYLLMEIQENLKYMKVLLEHALMMCHEADGPKRYIPILSDELKKLESLFEINSYTEMRNHLQNLKFPELDRKSVKSEDKDKVKRIKGLRNEVKDYLKKVENDFFYCDIQTLADDMTAMHDNVKTLIELVKRFSEEFATEKRNKNLIDFNDMEQYALQILTREENGMLVPSEVAESYQQKFAEVMIDEYQDSNYVQETIMSSVSGVSKGNYNRFMVGDVKQSIYRFRLSRPELFMKKFHSYSTEDSKKQRIDLHKNFRSRKEVLDSINFIFHQTMIPKFGGIDYDDNAALHKGAKYPEAEGNETEVLLLEMSEGKKGEHIQAEAETIARRIKELMANHTVFDNKTGKTRPVRYGDIVVLLKSVKEWGDVFSRVFADAGIPAHSRSKEGYFGTQEIQIVLNYLQILDNPRQDIPLTAVLRSVFAGVNSEELAIIRSSCNKGNMYDCICYYAEHGEIQELKNRVKAFLCTFENFRNRVPYESMHVLLWTIVEETGYLDYISALPGGEQRVANLEMLMEKAIAFEGTSYKGLFNFVRYVEQLKRYEVDYGEANVTDENADVVSIMTIHKSKGLEFPIVFVAGMSKRFNMQDSNNSVVVHSELGVGVNFIDSIRRIKAPTVIKKIIQLKIRRELAEEELRILYVALTRAKEKLIITGFVSDLQKEMNKYECLQLYKDVQLPYYILTKALKCLDWILPAISRTQLMKDVPIAIRKIPFEQLAEKEIEEQVVDQITKSMLLNWDIEDVYDENIKEQLAEQFAYQYPYESSQSMKQKLSVSELKKRAYVKVGEDDDDSEQVFKEEEVIPLLPKFLQQKEALTGASKGTAYHKLLEILDFTKDYDEVTLANSIANYVRDGFLTPEMAACIQLEEILGFLHSTIGRRVQAANRKGMYFAEQPFVMGVAADRVYEEADSKECILVQGIIDVYFEEDEQLVVLDYKTDKVWQSSELVDRYRAQLDYYAEALENLTGKQVKEKVIYSFALQETITLE